MSTLETAGSSVRSPKLARLIAPLVAARFRRALAGARIGAITMRLPDGTVVGSAAGLPGGQPGPVAHIDMLSWRMAWRAVTGGLLGLAASWRDGEWETPDLAAVLDFGIANEAALSSLAGAPYLAQKLANLRHRFNANTRRGSRKNIAFHYDLGNAFYARWLDPSMTYSAALYTAPEQSLEQAQLAKYRRIVDELQITADDSVLEIGCGWGGFAEFAARETGCLVTAITVSEAQAAWAVKRMEREGLASQVEVRLQDYRDCTGSFSKIVSIEMFEAVGAENWAAYFNTVKSLLAPDGAALIQTITINEAVYEVYQRSADFIQTYIFPGGILPSRERFAAAATASGLEVADVFCFGRDYERTLLEWDAAFNSNWADIAPLGFDERFRRLWTFYLHYCASGFRNGRIDVAQIKLSHEAGA